MHTFFDLNIGVALAKEMETADIKRADFAGRDEDDFRGGEVVYEASEGLFGRQVHHDQQKRPEGRRGDNRAELARSPSTWRA